MVLLKKTQVNFQQKYPTFIVGLNDVGKTAFLNAIWSLKSGVMEKFMLLHRSHPHIPIDAFYKSVRGGWLIDQKKVLNYARKGTFIRRNKEIRK